MIRSIGSGDAPRRIRSATAESRREAAGEMNGFYAPQCHSKRRLRLLTLRIVVACNGTLLQAVIDRIESIKHDYSQVSTRKERKRVKRNGAGQKRVARVAESKEFEVSFYTFTGGRSVSGSLCSAGRLIVLIRRHGIELRATCTRTHGKVERAARLARALHTA